MFAPTDLATWDEYSAEWLLAAALRPDPPPVPAPARPLWHASAWALAAWGEAVGMGREGYLMAEIAINSQALESQPWDRWPLHASAVHEAYTLGRTRAPLSIYHWFRWHNLILPHGGTLRTCDPVSIGMGESFAPADYRQLPKLAMAYLLNLARTLADDANPPFENMAALHFEAWRVHFWPDGNKRHCRLVSNYVAGWYERGPINVTLKHKTRYLDALQDGDIPALAALLADCEAAL